MQSLAKYWTMLKLSSDGRYQPAVQSLAQLFFQAQFSDVDSLVLDDYHIQRHLLSLSQPEAPLCLRCY